MEDQNKETTEVVETEEKKPNKIVQFVKDHKDRIREPLPPQDSHC